MPIAVRCPNPACGKVGEVADHLVGHSGRCPRCRTKFKFQSSPLQTLAAETVVPPAVVTTANTPVPGTSTTRLGIPAAPTTAPGRVGRFEIRARLGSGAFGDVYHAYDAPLDREVAVKVPRPEVVDRPDRVERFLREARAAAQLRHPHIVPVFDAGRADGVYYIASAYIAGKSLAQTLKERRPDPDWAARIVRDLAEAVAYAHRQGVVHRDIKPANVMVDARGRPHLLDFGLAARRDDADKLTHAGAVLGTPSYMAPEHARGHSAAANPPSDQYSLGVVLYELLTGRTPFEGPAALVLFHAINTEPPPPRGLNPAVPPDLETICLKAMHKRPEDRYADCGALADDLRRWLEGRPIAARRLSVAERAARWVRREPVMAGLLLLTAVCLVVVAVVATGGATKLLRAQRNIAADHREALRTAQAAEQDAADAKRSADDAAAQAQREEAASAEAQAKAEEAKQANREAEEKAAQTKKALADAEEHQRTGRKKLYDTLNDLARRALESDELDSARDLLDRQPADLRDDEWRKLDKQLKDKTKP